MGKEQDQVAEDIQVIIGHGMVLRKGTDEIAASVVTYLLRNGLLRPQPAPVVTGGPLDPENPADRVSAPATGEEAALPKARLALLDGKSAQDAELQEAGNYYRNRLPFTFGIQAWWCTDDSAHDYHYRIDPDGNRGWCGGTPL